MTFFIVLFIVLMQFLWKYINDLVGKGLSFGVIIELFFYAATSMVPMALPLAILLASLMTFGNLGEKSELTAIKASGISLLHVMRPLIVLVMMIAVGAFFFQNDVLPRAQVKMWTLLFSMKQKSPELEIPEGVFYDRIPGYNIYVKTKDKDSGMLYDVMIYDVSHGGDNSTILLADSARLATTPDSRFLYLHLFEGEQFENLREQNSYDKNVPFRRESFLDKEILIPFDANFNRLDEGGMRKQYVGKNISELRESIDSVGYRVDSIGRSFVPDFKRTAFPGIISVDYFNDNRKFSESGPDDMAVRPPHTSSEASAVSGEKEVSPAPLNLDSLMETLTPARRGGVIDAARNFNRSRSTEIQYRAQLLAGEKKNVRMHEIELIKKFTLSVACIIFFFIGAPLGAIIRKGGLGTPLVISVLLFLFYYIIDNTGYKMARDGHIAIWIGMWLSTFVLLPLGIYVTYKAMNDSSVFDKDAYRLFFRHIFGIREHRNVVVKEVVINDVDTRKALGMLARLRGYAADWLMHHRRLPSYREYWGGTYYSRKALVRIGDETDRVVEYLQDSRNLHVVDGLNRFPVIKCLWIYRPTYRKGIRRLMLWFVPVGVPIWLASLYYGRRLRKEMLQLKRACVREMSLVNGKIPGDNELSRDQNVRSEKRRKILSKFFKGLK